MKAKKILSVFLSLLLIFINISYISAAGKKGDVDLNGSIEAADARRVLRASVGLEVLKGYSFINADADCDGKITSADARIILRISVGLDENGNTYFEVHFIDVGQADSALIICDDETMLIDGGNVADSSLVVSYLMSEGVTELDYVVCTHAHEDHAGGLSGPLNKFTVTKSVFAPETGADTKCYRDFQNAAAKQGKTAEKPDVGYTFSVGSSDVEVLGPVTENYSDVNNTSIVLKVTYGSTSFLFTGDAEDKSETDIINSGADLSADVLKVGHHGSSSSTTYRFLREIMPQYAVISCGKDNKYGHPDEEVLSRLRDADVKVFRTDLQGHIVAESDGKKVTFITEKNQDIETNPTLPPESEYSYIGNVNSGIFHRSSCSSLPAENNRVYFISRTDAVNKGYRPCNRCKP